MAVIQTNQNDLPFTLGNVSEEAACCVPTPHIVIKNLAISYNGKIVLDEVSLDINRGCITALIGPSGCGKSSFLSSLNRLIDAVPGAQIRGEIYIDGENILDSSIDVFALRLKVGMIFQKPNPFPLSIRKNLELPLLEHGIVKRAEIDTRIEQVLSDVGLWEEVKDRLDSSALSLSGGQQQRLCIARALTLEPEILLMDEPCSALDPISVAVVEDMIRRLNSYYTIVIVTHNLAQARRLSNYAAFFWVKENVGKLIEVGQCPLFFDSPQHQLTTAYVSGLSG